MAGGPSERKEGKGKMGNGRGFEGGLIALIGVLAGERKEGRLTGGAQVSATAKEKEKREGEVGRRGTVSWAGRPGWAER
jgi:hypothetical protein